MQMERNKESEGQNTKIEERNRKREFKGLVVGRSKSLQEIGTQIDRLADEFQKGKKGSSEEIHDLDRDGDRNSGDWAKC